MKDDLSDPYGLYEESYWDSVRRGRKPKNARSKDQGEGRSDQVSPEEPEREVHKPSRNKKKGAKRRPYRRRTGTQNKRSKKTLDTILS